MFRGDYHGTGHCAGCQIHDSTRSRLSRFFLTPGAGLYKRIQNSLMDKSWLEQVVRHKAMFFQEKDQAGAPVDYQECLNGHLCLVPDGAAREVLREDYNSMIRDGILLTQAPEFDVVLE